MDFIELNPEEQNAVVNDFNYAVSYEECEALASQYNIDTVYGAPVDEVISAALEDDNEAMNGSGGCGKTKTKEEVSKEFDAWIDSLNAPSCFFCGKPTQLDNCGWSGDVKNPGFYADFRCTVCGKITDVYP